MDMRFDSGQYEEVLLLCKTSRQPDLPWGPCSGCKGLFYWGWCSLSVKLTAYCHLLLSLWKLGGQLLISPLSSWCGG